MSYRDADIWHMRSALNMARTGLGRVAPNPSVGCVILKDGLVIGRARTADGGRPHAETQALAQAGKSAQGATAFVTLEPCAHIGKTPPCAQALIDAGLGKVVIGTLDPDTRVSGQGISMLQNAGIEVVTGVLDGQCRALNAGYFLAREKARPLITLKTASTLDSKIATASGESKWITGVAARRFAHIERSQHDAILVGVNTILADNPSLTSRIEGVDHAPVRIVLDTQLRLSSQEKLFDFIDKNPVWVVTSKSKNEAQMLLKKGAEILTLPVNEDGQIDLKSLMGVLAEKGLTRVLVEGGAQVATGFLKCGLFDRFLWFHSASILGSGAYNSIQEININNLNNSIKLKFIDRRILGQDMLDIYEKAQ